MNFKESKQAIRDYLRQDVSDRGLVSLIDNCRAGRLEFTDTCQCLIGLTTENRYHEEYVEPCKAETNGLFHGVFTPDWKVRSLSPRLRRFIRAEMGAFELGRTDTDDPLRNRVILAIAKAELRHRTRQMLENGEMAQPAQAEALV